MIVLRCTQRILKGAKAPVTREPPEPTVPLGEWYVNRASLPFPGQVAVVYTNSRTLLSIVVPGREVHSTVAMFAKRLPRLLENLLLPPEFVDAHRGLDAAYTLAPTANRSVLSSQNQVIYLLDWNAKRHAGPGGVNWDALDMEYAGTPMFSVPTHFPYCEAYLAAGLPEPPHGEGHRRIFQRWER